MPVYYSMFEGIHVEGMTKSVLLCGRLIVENGKFVGRRGAPNSFGKSVTRRPHAKGKVRLRYACRPPENRGAFRCGARVTSKSPPGRILLYIGNLCDRQDRMSSIKRSNWTPCRAGCYS